MTPEGVRVSEVLPLRMLLDEAVKQVRRHFRKMYPPVAIPLALTSGALPLAQAVLLRSFSQAGRSMRPLQVSSALGLWIAMMVLFVAACAVAYSVLEAAATDAIAGREVSMRRSYLMILRPRAFGTILLGGLLTGVGTLFCLLPGLYAALVFALKVPVMVDEERFGTRALRRSAELMGYNPKRQFEADPRLKMFLVYFVGALLGYVLGFVAQLPFLVAQQVMMFRNIASGQRADPNAVLASMAWFQVPGQILAMLTQVAVHLYVSFGVALLFFDLRRRKEGLDLETAIDELAARRPRSSPAPEPLPRPRPEGET